jgi:hypothetical protein
VTTGISTNLIAWNEGLCPASFQSPFVPANPGLNDYRLRIVRDAETGDCPEHLSNSPMFAGAPGICSADPFELSTTSNLESDESVGSARCLDGSPGHKAVSIRGKKRRDGGNFIWAPEPSNRCHLFSQQPDQFFV